MPKNEMLDIMAQIEKDRQESLARAARQRIVIIEALRARQVVSVSAAYDGSGDDGMLDEPTFTDSVPSEAVALYTATVDIETRESAWSEGPPRGWVRANTIKTKLLREAVHDLFYAVLEVQHPGWEINEGSFGEMTWDIASDKIHLSHNQRIESVETHEDEF